MGKMRLKKRYLVWLVLWLMMLVGGQVQAQGPEPVLVKDINPGDGDSSLHRLTNVNGTLFFTAIDGVHGRELWKSDCTAAGTVLVKDILPGNPYAPTYAPPDELTNVNGTLFFKGYDGINGSELWESDGTAAGTVLVKDIYPGSANSSPSGLTNVNGTLFFSATDGLPGVIGTHGYELWKSDGTAAGTVLVKDIYPGSIGSSPYELTNVDGTLFFRANDGVHGYELWKSDGTATGTVLVKDISPGDISIGSSAHELTNVNGTLFFNTDDGVNGSELWKSDGTAAGTVLVKDIYPGSIGSGISGTGPSYLTNVEGTLFFIATDGVHGSELWKSDGTTAGTVLVKDISPGKGGTFTSFNARINIDDILFFRVNFGINGSGLWKSDGTVAGTVLIKDILPGNLINVNNILFFSAYDGVNGSELWRSDGTTAGTVLVKNIRPGNGSSGPNELTNIDNISLFFSANGGVNGEELWMLSPIQPILGDTNTVTGQITDSNNNPMSGVTVSNNNGSSTATGSDGTYILSNLADGTYTFIPTKSDYNFFPPSRIISVPPNQSNQNFIAVAENEVICSVETALGFSTTADSVGTLATPIELLTLYTRFRDETLSTSPRGQQFINLFYEHTTELAGILMTDADLRSHTAQFLQNASEEFASLLPDATIDVPLEQGLYDEANALVQNLAAAGSPQFGAKMSEVWSELALNEHIGKNASEIWEEMQEGPMIYLPVIVK